MSTTNILLICGYLATAVVAVATAASKIKAAVRRREKDQGEYQALLAQVEKSVRVQELRDLALKCSAKVRDIETTDEFEDKYLRLSGLAEGKANGIIAGRLCSR